jgi:ADP-ribose pyrophosphatase YjhB (NUDIX family)
MRFSNRIDSLMYNKGIKASNMDKTLEKALSQSQMMFSQRQPTEQAEIKLGVGVFVVNDLGHVLLERRSDCGLWGLLGGRVEPGESIETAAIREVEEESGLKVAVKRLIGVYSEPTDRIVIYPDNFDERHLVDVIVEAVIIGGNISISEESLELKFFRLSELPDNKDFVPPARQPLRDFEKGLQAILK